MVVNRAKRHLAAMEAGVERVEQPAGVLIDRVWVVQPLWTEPRAQMAHAGRAGKAEAVARGGVPRGRTDRPQQ